MICGDDKIVQGVYNIYLTLLWLRMNDLVDVNIKTLHLERRVQSWTTDDGRSYESLVIKVYLKK